MGNELIKISNQLMTKERHIRQRMSLDACDEAAWTILNAYPNANIPNEAGYVCSMRELLLHFPESVAIAVASQKSGIVTISKFPPSLAEIQEFADPILDRMNALLKHDQDAIKRLAPDQVRTVSKEEEEYIATGLRALAKKLAAGLDMQKASRPRPRANQCASGDAIRKEEGWSRPETKTEEVGEEEHERKEQNSN